MLQYIQIKNLALMDESVLEFEDGFTVITGETGAGKSVLLGALALLAGNRVDKTIIRKGADACEVEASLSFEDCSKVDACLRTLDLPECEEGALVLRRSVYQKKAGRISVNGALATLTALRELGETWIDFHGPGEPQKLFHQRYQLEMLDLFANHGSVLVDYTEAYTQWRGLLKQAEELKGSEQLSEDEIEFMSGQIAAIDALDLGEDSVEALERDFNRLDSARELSQWASQLEQGILDDAGVVGQLANLRKTASDLGEIDEDAQALATRLDGVIIELEDLAGEYAELASGADIDEESAQSIQERMQDWLEVKRKYGPEVKSVLAKREALSEKIAMQSDIEGALHKLETEAAKIEKTLWSLAEKIRLKRMKAAVDLGKKSQKLLAKLGLKKAKLKIDIIQEKTLSEYGDSACNYLFAPNAGQDFLPLNKIASSGETARVMLAFKAVLATVDATPVLVFDEVDANVGGEIGAEVGKELARLSKKHQVFCVTHLPQVAAQGRQHYVVTKQQGKDSTSVTIEPIHSSGDAREVELARMLGDRTSQSALTHARELLGV